MHVGALPLDSAVSHEIDVLAGGAEVVLRDVLGRQAMRVLATVEVLPPHLVRRGGHAHGTGVVRVIAGEKALADNHVAAEAAVLFDDDGADPSLDALPGCSPTGAAAAHDNNFGLIVPGVLVACCPGSLDACARCDRGAGGGAGYKSTAVERDSTVHVFPQSLALWAWFP